MTFIQIHALVRNKAAFSKHPIHIRMRLCQVMIYQAYEPRRVIIKQGLFTFFVASVFVVKYSISKSPNNFSVSYY